MIWSSADLPAIDESANACTQAIIQLLTDEHGVHLETAITLAGSLSGVSILRSAIKEQKVDLSELIRTKPGSYVIVEKANDIGTEVSKFMMAFCQPMKINPQTGWNDPIPQDNAPHRMPVDLVRDFEAIFNALMDKHNMHVDLRPFATALAGLKLIVMGANVLNSDICKALLLYAMVSSSKTVPSN